MLAAFTVFTNLDHARGTHRRMGGWLVLAGLISAIGTWATHFIAMLAFDSGMPIYHDPALTLASALVAITLMPFGWWLSLKSSRSTAILAGLLVAAGISTMHYLGMAAMRLSGVLIWDPRIIVVSIVAVAPFSIAAVKLHRRQAGTIPWRPTLAQISAICGLHFIGMGSFTIVPGPARPLAGRLLDSNSLVALVLARTVLPVTIGFVVVLFERLSDREKAAGRIAHLAYHDALTGLSNRSVLETHLSQSVAKAAAAGEPLAVICIDLDGFKAVNDVHGHAMGDRLLIIVARRLRAIVRDGDLVARTGGDEFIVVQSGGTQPADARALTDRVIASLGQSFVVDGQALQIGASIGVAIFPNDAPCADELARKSDLALYRAKASGRGVACFYDGSIEDALRKRSQLQTDLAAAIRENQFRIVYQPIANAQNHIDRMFRSTAEMGSSSARTDRSVGVHTHCRGACADPRPRAVGAMPKLSPSGRLEAPDKFVRQRIAAAVPRGRPRTMRRDGARRNRARPAPAGDRGHRECPAEQAANGAEDFRRTQGAWRADLARRFWNRLFIAELFQNVSIR